MDLSKLSNEDLIALKNKDYSKLSNEGLQYAHEMRQQKPSGGTASPQFDNSAQGNQGSNPGSITQKNQGFVQNAKNLWNAGINSPGVQAQLKEGAQHPITGMDDPVYQALGLASGSSAKDLVLGAARGLRNFIAPAAQRAEVLNKVKNIGELEPYVASKVSEAKGLFNKQEISPRMLEQQSRLQGNVIKVNPEELKGLSPELDAYANSISVKQPDPYGSYFRPGSKAFSTGKPAVEGVPGQSTVVTHGYSGEAPKVPDNYGYPTEGMGIRPPTPEPIAKPFSTVSSPGTPGTPAQAGGSTSFSVPLAPVYSEIEIPAEEGLKIRAMLNDVAGWKAHPIDPLKAQALDSQVAKVHQGLASKLQEIDPAMGPLSQEMKSAYGLQNSALKGAGKNPVGSVLSADTPAGLVKKGRLSSFDEGAGSNLGQLGEDIKTAQDRLKPIEWSDLLNPTKTLKTLGKAGANKAKIGYDAAAEALTPQLQKLIGTGGSPAVAGDLSRFIPATYNITRGND